MNNKKKGSNGSTKMEGRINGDLLSINYGMERCWMVVVGAGERRGGGGLIMSLKGFLEECLS
jgi:hypothetical protein